MAKVAPRRQPRRQEKKTNWYLLGGIIALGVIGLFALLFLSLNTGPTVGETETEAVVADYCDRNPERCVTKGQENAPVTIVEVSDYGCSHCRNFNLSTAEVLDEMYVATGDVRWVVLPYALGPATQPAAEAAMCAQEQGKFWEYHLALFEQQTSSVALTREGFLQAGEQTGLDGGALDECLSSRRYAEVVQNNITIASRAGVTGTPTFYINGQEFSGNRPLEQFQGAIAEAMQ